MDVWSGATGWGGTRSRHGRPESQGPHESCTRIPGIPPSSLHELTRAAAEGGSSQDPTECLHRREVDDLTAECDETIWVRSTVARRLGISEGALGWSALQVRWRSVRRLVFPEALDEGQLEGAYRFLTNEAVTVDAMLTAPFLRPLNALGRGRHWRFTTRRCCRSGSTASERVSIKRSRRIGRSNFGHTRRWPSRPTESEPYGVLHTSHATTIEHRRWREHVEHTLRRLAST